jgi:DNA polymerase-3 subunit gamma/tau
MASELQKAGSPAISGPNTLVIRFPARYNQAREFCQEPSRVARIEEWLRRLTGQPCQLRIEAVSGGPTADSTGAAGESANLPSRYRRQRAEVQQEPLLKRAIEVLEAQIVQVDDGFGAAPTSAERGDAADGEEAMP